ncbi:MAG: flagellar hook-basal body complex protein FliE [Beijerinckiaceae bacterium]
MIPALSAIASMASQSLGGQNATTSGTATAPVDFGSVMAQVTQDTVGKLKSAEATAISGLQGQASVQQVVQTVMDAQSSLQTAIAVRDKLVSAYQELTRMAV